MLIDEMHEKIQLQKQIAEDVLKKLYLIDPHAIVAGGAVRDWFFEKPASDIDVFFHVKPQITNTTLNRMFFECGIHTEVVHTWEEDPTGLYKRNPHIKQVMEFSENGQKIQLIQMTESTYNSVVPHFPLNICKAWFKGGESYFSKEFHWSKKYNVIVKTSELYASGDKYINKILGKFPEMKYFENKADFMDYITKDI